MTEIEFEKEFPSLKGKVMSFGELYTEDGNTVEVWEIQEHCLDKQRVREAVSRIQLVHGMQHTDHIFDLIRKELGL